MITGTILKNGVIKLVLTGTDEIDTAIMAQLNGATCTLITDNYRIGEKNITNGLMIQMGNKQREDETTTGNTGSRLVEGT